MRNPIGTDTMLATAAAVVAAQAPSNQSPIHLLIDNLCGLNNGGIELVAEHAARLSPAMRLRLIERCASLVSAVAEKGAITQDVPAAIRRA